MSEKKKKSFKMPSSYTVLILIISFMAILTWFIPAGRYQVDESNNFVAGTYERVEQTPQGAYDVLMAPVSAMLGKEKVINEGQDNEYTIKTKGAIEVAFFILMVGAFLGVVTETGALDVGIASVVKRFKGKEKMLIPVLMTLFAIGGTTYGMGEETMAFYPLLIPVMLAVGFDTITGVAIILIGSQIGCLASTVNPFATGVGSDAAGISVADGLLLRFIFFVVLLAIGILFVYRYASKIEKDPTKSLVYKNRESDLTFFNVHQNSTVDATLSKSQKRVLFVFMLAFVIMILSLIPWSNKNIGITIFEDLNNGLKSIPVLGNIFGDMLPLGDWYFPEVTMLFISMSVLVAIVSGMGESRFIKAFMAGAADLLSVALICAVARGIQVVMNDGQISATILNAAEGFLKGFSSQVFIVLTYIFYLPMSFLIPSSSGLAGATIGIVAPLGEFAGVSSSLIVTAFQSASGLLNLLAPTSGIVMGALALGRVEYGTWVKFVGKLVAVVAFVSVILLVLGTFMS